MIEARSSLQLLSDGSRGVPVGGSCEHRRRGGADRLWCPGRRTDGEPDAERGAAGGVERLIGGDRQEHEWASVCQGGGHRAVAAVGDDGGTVRQQGVLGDPLRHVHVRPVRVDARRVVVAADGDDEVQRLGRQGVDDHRQQLGLVVDRAEGGVDGWLVRPGR